MLMDTYQFDLEAEDLERIRIDSAYMISRRGWPMGAQLELDPVKRLLTAQVPHAGGTMTSAALILQVDLPEIGQLKLRTTLLRPRGEPYELMLELARERIRHFLQKCEDWHMFAPNVAPEAKASFDRAREHLAAAVLEGDRGKKVGLARKSIVVAVRQVKYSRQPTRTSSCIGGSPPTWRQPRASESGSIQGPSRPQPTPPGFASSGWS